LLPEEEDEGRVKLTFDNHLKELTSAFRGDNALRNQKDYLKNTPKPDNQEYQLLLTVDAAEWTILHRRRSHHRSY